MTDNLARHGSAVTIRFSLSLSSGEVVEQTEAGETMAFVIGDGSFLPALENLLIGAQAGQTVAAELQPDEAFGWHDADNVHAMPRSQFPADMAFAVDDVIGFQTPAGDETPGRVLSMDDSVVEIDFNHPLAGQPVIFAAELVALDNSAAPPSNPINPTDTAGHA